VEPDALRPGPRPATPAARLVWWAGVAPSPALAPPGRRAPVVQPPARLGRRGPGLAHPDGRAAR